MKDNTLTPSYFPVIERPVLFDAAGDKAPSDIKGETGYKLIVRKDTNDVLSCVTDSYKLITNNVTSSY